MKYFISAILLLFVSMPTFSQVNDGDSFFNYTYNKGEIKSKSIELCCYCLLSNDFFVRCDYKPFKDTNIKSNKLTFQWNSKL